MANITDTQIIKFSNERARTISDKLIALYYDLVAFQADYSSNGISAKITASGTANNIGDGSDVDGRSLITGTSLVNLKAAVAAIQTAMESAVAGVGSPTTTIAGGIQVGGSPR